MLDIFIGSIKGYFYSHFPVQIYDRQLPETIKVPSMYFPQPNILHLAQTKDRYKTVYTVNAQLIEVDTPTAMKKAEEIAQSIRKNWSSIPILNEDGSNTEDVLVFDSVSSERMEDGIVEIRLEWEYEFTYNRR